MDKIVGICIALLVLAVAALLLTEAGEVAALFEAFRSQPLLLRAAWSAIVFVPLALLVCALLLSILLLRQRRATRTLSLRLDGVRTDVKRLINSQVDAEAAVHQLARSDPEDALSAMQQRLTEAEQVAQIQESRNEVGDLQFRVASIRAQQEILKDRMGPVVEKRRTIEQLFADLEGRQSEITRMLDDIASGDDAVAIDLGLNNMVDYVRQCHRRCDEIERASKLIVALKDDYVGLRDRIAPFGAAAGGVVSRLEDLREARARLAADIDSVQQTPQGQLSDLVQNATDERRALDGRLTDLTEEFNKLGDLRRDLDNMFAGFNRALDALAISQRGGNGVSAVDARVEELMAFIAGTRAHLHDIERRVVTLNQLKGKLDELRTQLGPLEATDSGVVSLLEQVKDVRDKLALKIQRLEESEEGDLADRVKRFTETKIQLEQRVSMLSDQFFKLATIRKDIAGLFEELSSAVSASAN